MENFENINKMDIDFIETEVNKEVNINKINDNEFITMDVYKTSTDYLGKVRISQSLIDKEIENQISNKFNDMNLNDKKEENKSLSSFIETIIILDRSGSMGQSVPRLYNKVIPSMLKKLGYSDSDQVYIITFDCIVDVYKTNILEMQKQVVNSRGTTKMKNAISSLKNILDKSDKKCIRILAISDGELHDQIETLEASSLISQDIKSHFQINSQAVRFFTSTSQPSTKGLSSVLQFNTKFESSLIDINSLEIDDEMLSSTICSLFSIDNFNTIGALGNLSLNIKDQKLLKQNPWKAPSDKINITAGENSVWLSVLPKNANDLILKIGNREFPVMINEIKTFSNDEFFNNIFKDQVSYYYNQIKLLKIVNTEKSLEEMNKIVELFKQLENSLAYNNNTSVVLENSKLNNRLAFLKQLISKRSKSVYSKFLELANDDKVNKLNSAQQADYLRNTDLNKNSKALARRAVAEGIDFDNAAREEVKNMRKHLHELSEVDDSNHLISFYSTCTTLDGIKAVCELVDDNLIEDADVNDIIKLLNIVGLGCDSRIGDFPDPMTWRVNKLYSGCYISISDILVGFESSKGQALVDVGTKQPIANVIPIFEDERIDKFINKYAPKLLEYTCSIGMRRIIADVPKTYIYTLLSGITNLIENMNLDKSEVTVRAFTCLIKAFEFTIGNAFKYVLNHLVDQDVKLSYYIANNGYSNMISPLIFFIKDYYKKNDKNNDVYEIKNLDRIIRALYSFEIYQIIRRVIKGANPGQAAKELLNELLCIDLEKDATKIPELFEESTNPVYHNNYTINETKLSELFKKIFYVDYMVLAPYMIKGAYINDLGTTSDDKKKTPTNNYDNELAFIKTLPTYEMRSDKPEFKKFSDFASDKLKLDYKDLNKFKFYNIIQALLFNTKSSRVDAEKEKMLITEVNHENVAEQLVRNYVQECHYQKYLSSLLEKSKKEKTILTAELVKKMIETKDITEFVNLFKSGLTRNHVNVIISDFSKNGFLDLHKMITDSTIDVPDRLKKIMIILSGKYNEDIVWNGGNCLRSKVVIDYVELYKTILTDQEEEFNSVYKEILGKNAHIYREMENRHGHGNDKPSYWALGFEMLMKYKSSVSETEFKEYTDIHHNCCGVPRIVRNLSENEIKTIYKEKKIDRYAKKKNFIENNKKSPIITTSSKKTEN